jgi:hypothetical protein
LLLLSDQRENRPFLRAIIPPIHFIINFTALNNNPSG